MRLCHTCHHELDATALAAGRCGHCGATIRPFAQRTIDERRVRRDAGSGGQSADESQDSAASDSGDISVTRQLSPEETAQLLAAAEAGSLPGKASDEVRKSPTVEDASDRTIEYQPTAGGNIGATIDPSATFDPSVTLDPDQAAASGDLVTGRPSGSHSRRSTHTIEKDVTLDLGDLSPEERERLESQWRGTFELAGKQSQTIRQKETVTGFRSSLPVKSRFVRERRKDGHPPASTAEIPDYELLEIIGQGGMGVVYAAHQSSIARTVAVKMLKPKAKIGEEQRDKFISEAVVTGELDHPNIVPIYDLGANTEGALFYSMKRVKGTPWDSVLARKSLDENLSILMRVADAVAFAHAHGVVHRDLKPENVMLGDYGEVLVMDWGLARITSSFANADAIVQIDNLGGTPAYMAPEMARGPVENINFTSDIYLLGAILYELIGGQPPHSGRDVMQCLMNAAQNQIDPIRYDGELKEIALRAMTTRQEDRYGSVKEFQEAIGIYQSHSESLVLTAHASQNLQKARTSGDYPLFARAVYGFQEALALWDANARARTQLAEAQRDYAANALGKGDLDLAASLLVADNAEHAALLGEIETARAERDARQRRLRLAKRAVAALLVTIFTTVSVAFFWIRAARNDAVHQKDLAVAAQAEEARQRSIAEEQEREAVRQKMEADEQRDRAEAQETIARREEKRAKEQEGIARQEEQKAKAAKEAEEYEAYVAKIGLAAAKINDNAFDFAGELLDELRRTAPQRCHWEWGRLAHLCQLEVGTFAAEGPVDSIAISPDGRQIASGDRAGEVAIRDARTGDVKFHEKQGRYVFCVAYSPDGRHLATGSSDHAVRVLDAASGQLLATLDGHADGVLGVEFSPDGDRLLSCSYDNTARLWDWRSGKTLQTFRGHSWWVWKAIFSPDGRRIVTASQDGKAIVWQQQGAGSGEQGAGSGEQGAASGQAVPYVKLTEFVGHKGAVYAASFSPDGRLVATGSNDKSVMIWNPDEVAPIDLKRRLDGEPDPPIDYLTLTGHDQPIRSVAFSPSGRLVASGSDDNAIRVWDVARGELRQELRGHGNAVRSCVFSPDGELVISGGHDERVRLWNLAGYQETLVLHSTVYAGHQDAVLSAAFSPDGKRIITASRDRTARVWDVANGKSLRTLDEGHEFLATSAVFFGDGRRLATAAGDGTVRIWDLPSGGEILTLAPTGRIGALAVSPDGDWLVTGSRSHEATLWDSHSGQALATLAGHQAEVSAVAFAPRGGSLATGDDLGRIRLWRRQGAAAEWTLEHELRGHRGTITGLRFTPAGDTLVSASGDLTCGQWDVATGQEKRELVLKHPEYVSSLDLSADGNWAITTCDDGAARVWRLADASVVRTLPSPKRALNYAAFSPDGRRALVTSAVDRFVWVWDLGAGSGDPRTTGAGSGDPRTTGPGDPRTMASGDPRTMVAAPDAETTDVLLDFNELGGEIWSAVFDPEGKHVLSIGGNDVQLWSIATGQPVVQYSPHGAVASAAISPDGRLAVTGSWDRSAKIWDVATGRVIRKLTGGHDGFINTAEFSPDGREVLTASDDGTARTWVVESGRPTGVVLRGHTGRVWGADFSSDGQRVLTVSGDGTARIWDRRSAQPLVSLDGHESAVRCGAFSPDAGRLVTGSEDTTARIWDARSGQEVMKLAGHTAGVIAVAFSPDGSRVLTGSQDNTVKLWDPWTGKEILSLTGHEQEVTSVAFSPDGRLALSSSRDGTAIVWLAVDWRDEASRSTAMSGRLRTLTAN